MPERRDKSLQELISSAWDDPDALYPILLVAIQHNLFSEIVAAAEHLFRTDKRQVRSVCIWAIVLTALGRDDEAKEVSKLLPDNDPDEDMVDCSRNRVYSPGKEHSYLERKFWYGDKLGPIEGPARRSIVDRRDDALKAYFAALDWLAALHREWQAMLAATRKALQARNWPKAASLYVECLSRSPRPIAGYVLLQMCFDLQEARQSSAILILVAPEFYANVHGPLLGCNLIGLYLELGQTQDARRLLDQLDALNCVDWLNPLKNWHQAIADQERSGKPRKRPHAIIGDE